MSSAPNGCERTQRPCGSELARDFSPFYREQARSRKNNSMPLVLAAFALTFCMTTAAQQTPFPAAIPAKEIAPRTPPKRVVSLSLCLDELVIVLSDRQHIAAVSRLAHDPLYSVHWQAAQTLRSHNGLAEQIVALQPDLIVGADYEHGKAVQVLRTLGFPVLTFASPATLAEIPGHIRAVATALGATAKAEQVIAKLNKELAAAQAKVAGKPAQLALSYAPNGYTAGTLSLKNELLHVAGFVTVADRLGRRYDSELALEQLLKINPDRIFLEERSGNQNSLAHRLLQHPTLRSAGFDARSTAFPSQLWLCPGPQAGAAARMLAESR